MTKNICSLVILAALLCAPSLASAYTDDSAEFFIFVYLTFCKPNAENLDALAQRLKAAAALKLPQENAKLFTKDTDGDAWAIPYHGAIGNFVLAMPKGKKICAVYARRVNTETLDLLFSQVAETAPAPSVASGKHDEPRSVPDGEAHTVSYIWSTPGEPKRLLFMLTTSTSPSAQPQAMATVSVIGN